MPRHSEARTTPQRQQLTLPGQAHTAEGPHDQTGMYVMHHALRRDFAKFVAAAKNTPISEHAVWTALLARWLVLADVLHHHHSAEDAELWPLLQQHAQRAGAEDDLMTLADMEAEHERLDAALAAGREAFTAMSDHPCPDHRNALEIRLSAAHEALLEHLAHEEAQALPMLQRSLSEKENQDFEKAVGKRYPLRMIPFLLPWAMEGVPDEARERLLETTPPGYGLLLRLLRGRYERGERRAFRYA
jgi:iron-sulfur cluster repair protein YtfE (RIC family)